MHILTTSISRPGKRANNEDAVYPFMGSANTSAEGLFIVCDGVGGADKGEVASNLTVSNIVNYYAHMGGKSGLSANEVQLAIEQAERAMDDYNATHPESRNMATTLAMLHIADNVGNIVHVGDSRVYHIRNGQILFRTKDHSLVQELVDGKFITEEQAKTHPKRNVITRAISGSNDAAKADTYLVNDIQEGDCFFLCTDGILESLTDESMESLFTHRQLQNGDLSTLMDAIDGLCAENSNDNYSAVIVYINGKAEDRPQYAKEKNVVPLYQNENVLIALIVILLIADITLLVLMYISNRTLR